MAKLPEYFVFRVWMTDHMTIEIRPVEDPDVVPVIRCKDCAYAEIDDPDNFPELYLCHQGSGWNNKDHFCSYGIKRRRQHA